MNKTLQFYVKLLPFLGIGLVAAVALVAGILYVQRGAHVELTGRIQKVRTLAIDENSSAVFLDFRITNPSDYPFKVRETAVSILDASGKKVEGSLIAESDSKRLFEYFPALGQKFNDGLLIGERIKPHQTCDRMLAMRFEIPEKDLQARKELRVRIDEVDGPVSEMVEAQGSKVR